MEQAVIPLHVFPPETNELAHAVEFRIPEFFPHRCLIVDVRRDLVNALRQLLLPAAPVEHRDVPERILRKSPHDRRADGPCSADK